MAWKKRFAWSFTALDSFELCPKKHYCEKIAKTHGEPYNPQRDHGAVSHKAFEKRLQQGTPLPRELTRHEPVMAKLDNLKGHGEAEISLVLTRDFEETTWNDWDHVWVRGKADYLKTSPDGTSAFVVDHKFGKQHNKFDQLDLMAAMTMTIRPQIVNLTAAYYWAKNMKMVRKKYTAEDKQVIWSEFLPRVAAMEQAFESEEYPAKRNFLCKKWCPVKECQYNGI